MTDSLTGGQLIAMTAVVVAGIVSAVAVVAPLVAWNRRAEGLTQLKRDMVAGGYTAADIERVARAGPAAAETPADTFR